MSGGGEREKGGHVLRTPLAAACAFESGHLTLLSGAGEGEVVSKEVGEERGAHLDFGVFAFLSFSLGPAGDCPCRHYVRGESWLP